MSTFHNLSVSHVENETKNCVSIYFQIPQNLKTEFAHEPGQYLTIKSEIKGEDVRRAYSICTAPHEELIGVSVKRLKGGKMSNYLNDTVKPGDSLEVMIPQGKFVAQPDHLQQRDHYFFAAGSGITPVMSMIKTLLENEPRSSCYLIYGNRNEENIIFKNTLEQLMSSYKEQLYVRHTLSQPLKEKKGGLFGAFSKGKITWKGDVGRINKSILDKWMHDHESKTGNNLYYICGPAGMISTVRSYLLNKDVDENLINIEYFTSDEEKKAINTNAECTLTTIIEGTEYTTIIKEGKTVLDSLLDEKIDAPFSCTSGACSTCMAKIIDGSAEMEACFALDDSEVAEGYLLTCQTKPTSSDLKITFDV